MKTDLGRKLAKMGRDLMALADLVERTASKDASLDGEALPGGCFWRADRSEARRPDGTTVALTKSEAKILDCLLENRGTIVPRNALLAALFGSAAEGVWSRAADAHVVAIRKKLGEAVIRTASGKGYMID